MKEKISLHHVIAVTLVVVANVYSMPLMLSLSVDLLLLLMYNKGIMYRFTTGNLYIVRYIFLLFLYTLSVCIINATFDTYTIGKPLRMLVFYVMLIMLSRGMIGFSKKEIIAGLIIGLSIHLLCVYIQFFIPATKSIFYGFLRADHEKDITELALRAFGLSASFDGAGLCVCVLLVIFSMLYKETKKLVFFCMGIFTFVGCFMVGRTSMLVGTVIFVTLLLSLIKSNKFLFILSIIITAMCSYYVFDIAKEILIEIDVTQSYRPETITRLSTSRMLFLPESVFLTMFGTGLTPSESDIGYIKIIHMIGIIGLIFVLGLYNKCIKLLTPVKRTDKCIYRFMCIFLLLLLAYNYKLLLLYSSGINDLFMFLCFLLINKCSVKGNKMEAAHNINPDGMSEMVNATNIVKK